jgi:hypothetical protein
VGADQRRYRSGHVRSGPIMWGRAKSVVFRAVSTRTRILPHSQAPLYGPSTLHRMAKIKSRCVAIAGIAGFGITAVLAGAGSAAATVTVLDHDGVYPIPGDIAPGQYMTRHANQDCAWSVSDGAGNVLFSGGIGSAIRGTDGQIQIGIPNNAASFSTTSCGVWQLVDSGRQPTGPSSGSSGLGF